MLKVMLKPKGYVIVTLSLHDVSYPDFRLRVTKI